ncbi:MAG: FAD-dependent oxidoreductase [Planctomycetaceae bacterium]|nr:FAD-dependent oxidoreductase [Planctomycetaceae bacterium]
MKFDLIIMGDTPDAWTAAEEAARLGRRCAVLRPDVDGRGTPAGVASILSAYGNACEKVVRRSHAAPRDLWSEAVARHESLVAQLGREGGIRSWRGPVRLTGANSAEVFVAGVGLPLEADVILIAVGTIAKKPRGVEFDRQTIFAPEDVATLASVPPHLAVLGGSPTATAFAGLFHAAGSNVTLIDASRDDRRPSRFGRIGADVLELHRDANGVKLRMSNGDVIETDAVLFAAKRHGATASLGLAAAGLEADDEGRLWCDERGQTWQPSIVAAGEVVGFPHELRHDRDAVRRSIASRLGSQIAGRIDAAVHRRVPVPAGASHRRAVSRKHEPALRLFTVESGG